MARHYARRGQRLALGGRNADRLAALANDCQAAGAEVATRQIDVTDQAGMRVWLESEAAVAPLGLVIANAGISAGPGASQRQWGEDDVQVRQVLAVNWDGVLNTVHPAIAAMTAQGYGQIAIISSMAGLRGLPTAPAYSASKTAVRAYGEALAGALAPAGVTVSVVLPGFIHTPLTAGNPFPMPGAMSPDDAARRTAQGLARGKVRIAYPFWFYAAMRLLNALPINATTRWLARLPGKPPDGGASPQ